MFSGTKFEKDDPVVLEKMSLLLRAGAIAGLWGAFPYAFDLVNWSPGPQGRPAPPLTQRRR